MAGAAKPMRTDREWVWLAGLLVLVGAPVLVFFAVGTLPGTVEPVAFHVADDEPFTGVDVRIDRLDPDNPGANGSTVERRYLEEGVDIVVFRTRTVGAYEVQLVEGHDACTRVVRIRRDADALEPTVRRPADSGGDCPVSFYVESGSHD